MQLLTFMGYACVCVAVAVGIAPDQIRRPGGRWVGYLVLSASVAAMSAALWFVSRPIPSLTVPNTPPHEEAAAPSPHPVSPPFVVPPPSTGEPGVAPDTSTAAAVPTQPAVATPPGHGSTPPSAPSGPTPPPTQPPPTQPPPTQPPPTDHPANPAQHLVRSVIQTVETVVGSLHRAV